MLPADSPESVDQPACPLLQYSGFCQQADNEMRPCMAVIEIAWLHQYPFMLQQGNGHGPVIFIPGNTEHGIPPAFSRKEFGLPGCAGKNMLKHLPVPAHAFVDGLLENSLRLQPGSGRQLHRGSHGQIGVGNQFQPFEATRKPCLRAIDDDPRQFHLWQSQRLAEPAQGERGN